MKKKFYIVIALIVTVTAVLVMMHTSKGSDVIKNGRIKRSYDELLKYLDEEPKDITAIPYQENIPKKIQSDIEMVVNSNRDLEIVYSNDEGSSIIISKEEDTPLGVRIDLREGDSDYLEDMTYHIAFYKKGDAIVFYGSSNRYRQIESAIVTDKTVVSGKFYITNMDLLGTNLKEDSVYDSVHDYNESITLVRIKNEFLFYRLGKQVGKTFRFPGGNIKDTNHYQYYLDDKNDLYYMYYTDNAKKPWVKFIKVAESIDSIEKDKSNYFTGLATTRTIVEEDSIEHPIYVKDGKRYSGITNPETEISFGASYGRAVDNIAMEAVDFKLYTLELDSNIDSVTFEMRGTDISEYNWYIKTNYKIGKYQVYTEERINGLDSYLSKIIPEEKLKKFDKKKVKVEKKEEIIKKLRKLYKKYE